MNRKITKSEPTTIAGIWKVTLECGHVRRVSRLKKPSRPIACGECQLRVNVSEREIEKLAIDMHRRSGDPKPWSMKAVGYRDVLRKEAAYALGTKFSNAG